MHEATICEMMQGGHFYVNPTYSGSFESLSSALSILSAGKSTVESIDEQLRHEIMSKAKSTMVTPLY